MKKITFLFTVFLTLTMSWLGNAQTSTLYFSSIDNGCCDSEKWVDITTGPNSTGTVIWAQGNGTYGDSQGLVTDQMFTVTDGTTYYVNAYDRYDDSWDDDTYEIRDAVGGQGNLVANNNGNVPDDGNDEDSSFAWGNTQAQELEVSEAFSYTPPACSGINNLAVTNFTAPGNADLSWDATTGATGYNWEIQAQGVAQGDAAVIESGSVTTNMTNATTLVNGTDYTLYIQSDCGGGALGTFFSLDFTYIIPPVNDLIAGAIPIIPSAEGTGCATNTFQAHSAGDGTTDSGLDGTCDNTDTGIDVFYTWTATSDALIYNDGAGSPGIVIRDAAGTEIACSRTFAPTDLELSGWAIGDDLIIQIYDFSGSDVDVSFCLEELMLPTCPDVTNLAAANFSTGNTDLSWDATTGATGYNWEIQAQGVAQGDAAVIESGNVTTNMANATTLVNGTDYTLYVQPDCGSGDLGNYVSTDFTYIIPPANDLMAGAIPIIPSAEGTGCATNTFQAHFAGDGTTDSGLDGTCLTTDTGLDVFYTWTATSDALIFNDGAGAPGIVIRDSAGTEIACSGTFAPIDFELSGWAIGDDLIIQIYDFSGSDVDVSFCLEELMLPACPDVTNLDATNFTTPGNADLTWDAETLATSYNWEIQEQGVAQGDAAVIESGNVSTNMASTTALVNGTDYTLYVQSDCGAGTADAAYVALDFTFEIPPANDNVCDAIEIIVDADSAGDAFTDEFSTAEVGEVEGSCFDGGLNGSVWFTFVAPVDGEVQVTTDIAGGTHADTEIAVYEAPTDCTDASTLGAELGCDQDSGDIVFNNSFLELTGLTAGNTYYIQVDKWGTASTGTFGLEVNIPPVCPNVTNLSASNFLPAGTADLAWGVSAGAVGYNWEIQPQGVAQGTAGAIDMGNVATNAAMGTNMVVDAMYTLYVQSDCDAGALGNFIATDFTFILAPANDLCADAIALTVGIANDENVVMGNNSSTTDSGEVDPSCANYAGGDMWYSAVVPANGNMIIETSSTTGGDGGLAVYSGACGALTELACSDDDNGRYGLIELTGLTAGDTLLIRVWEYGNNAIINFNVVAYSPLCPDVANISASNFLPAGTADLAWDVSVGAVGYNWEIQPQGVAQGTAGQIDMGNVATNAAMGTNMVVDAMYTLYVQSDCGTGALGNWISLDFTFLLPPVNDVFAGAIPITPSLEGTGCGTATFTLPFSTDGTTDSGLDSSCIGVDSGLDQFFTWTATTNALTWSNQSPGNPGIAVYDTAGTEIACFTTFRNGTLNGWNVGDDLVIQIFDFTGSLSDVAFCLEELDIQVSIPDCASNFMPADLAIDQVLDPLVIPLSWDAPTTGDAPDSYNVYVGTDPTALGLFTNTTDLSTEGVVSTDLTTIYWQVVPVNAAGEAVGCSVQSFTTMDSTADTDGDGVTNGDEATNDSDIYDSCDPVQVAGYTGYVATNADWLGSDCDGDGQDNETEFNGGSDPYDANSVVSVDELETVGFTYYPNPVKDQLTMSANENINVVTIFNTLGQEVLRVEPSNMETSINVARLANGTYFVKAEVGNSVGTFKVVKN